MPRISMKDGIDAFLGLTFEKRDKPFRTKRDARDEAMLQVGFTQAQHQLRHILSQCTTIGTSKFWVPPEFPTKR